MKFEVTQESGKGIQEITLYHKGEQLVFPTPSYKSASITARDELFDHTNTFLEKLGEERTDALWQVYQQAHEIVRSVNDIGVMQEELSKVVAKLYEIVEYEDVRKYVYRGDIQFPPNLKTDYTEADLRTRNYQIRTYLRDEYIDLVVLVMGLRFMIPIWGMSIGLIAEQHGNLFKEQVAVKVLDDSLVSKWEPFTRLIRYVECSVDDKAIGLSVMFGCLSTSEIPEHLTALALVRKLAPATLNPRQDGDNLIKILFNFISHTNDRMDTRFGGRVSSRNLIRENAEEDNSSVWDVFTINQEIPHGDQVTIEVFTENVELMAKRLYEDIDMDKVKLCLKTLGKYEDIGEYYHQLPMVMWVMGEVIPPNGFEGLSHDAIYRCMAVSQAWLWQHGFYELAILMTASRATAIDDDEFIALDLSKVEKALVERLNILYPYWRQETGRIIKDKRTNLALKAIDKVCKETNVCEWKSNAPEELNKLFDGLASDKTWVLSGDIKSQLASLILKLYEKTE